MKIILFATPEFAIPTLKKLFESKHEIVAVYTKPPKEQGRGMKLQNTPIYDEAEKLGLKVYTPKSLKKPEEWEKLREFNADIFVVVAYGLILPKEVLDIAKYGCVNIHPSLLPRWRGSSPLQRALLEGDEETGVCVMKLGEGIDDGDIIECAKIKITPKTTLEQLHDELSVLGADLMLNVLDEIEKSGKVIAQPQSNNGIIYAEKISKEEGLLDFNMPVDRLDRIIRTFGNNMGSYFEYNGERIKIIAADIDRVLSDEYKEKPNGFIDNKTFYIKCSDGVIKPKILQREGKKPLKVEEFLRGFKF